MLYIYEWGSQKITMEAIQRLIRDDVLEERQVRGNSFE